MTTDTPRRGPTMEGAPDDGTCDACGLHFYVCMAVGIEAIRRGGVSQHRATVEAELLAGTWPCPTYEQYEALDDAVFERRYGRIM